MEYKIEYKKERQKRKHKNTKLQSKMYSNAVDMNIFSSDHSKVFFLSFSMFMKSKTKKRKIKFEIQSTKSKIASQGMKSSERLLYKVGMPMPSKVILLTQSFGRSFIHSLTHLYTYSVSQSASHSVIPSVIIISKLCE